MIPQTVKKIDISKLRIKKYVDCDQLQDDKETYEGILKMFQEKLIMIKLKFIFDDLKINKTIEFDLKEIHKFN